jgi:hypothetical protein
VGLIAENQLKYRFRMGNKSDGRSMKGKSILYKTINFFDFSKAVY